MSKLTDAQIYALRRLNSGRSYSIRTDGKKAFERLPVYGHKNAPSIPALCRLGYAKFVVQGDRTYHQVQITQEGIEAARTLKVSTEL